MDETTEDTDNFTIYQSASGDNGDALYVNGEMVFEGQRQAVMADALQRLGVDVRRSDDHVYNGNFVRDLADIRLNKRTTLRKKAQELETEGNEVVAALHEIDGMYWGPFDEPR